MTTQEQLIPLGSNWPEDARRAYLQLSEVIKNLTVPVTIVFAQNSRSHKRRESNFMLARPRATRA
jgi:hypothetical protein